MPLSADQGAAATFAMHDAGVLLFTAQASILGGLHVIKEMSKTCQPAAA